LERDGVHIADIPYLQRQAARIESSLVELNNLTLPSHSPYNDAELRLGCYIDWAKFRKRIDFSQFTHLEAFHAGIQKYTHFKETDPR
jgi:glutathione S-transferase